MPASVELDSLAGADGWLRVDGLRLRYRDGGDHRAPPVVMLHGLMGHGREWDVLIDALSGRHRVLDYDQRGHGASDWAADYRLDAMRDDLVAVLQGLGLSGVTLIGHSLGGLIGTLCAAERPDLVSRLVIIDVCPDSLTTEWARRELPVVLHSFQEAHYAAEAEAVDAWLSGDPLAREPLMRHYVRHALTRRGDRWVWRFDAAGLARLLPTMDPVALWSAVDRVVCPTLVVRGEHSHLVSAPAAAELLGRLADGRLVEIPGGGHDLGVQQPEAVAVAVRGFLGW